MQNQSRRTLALAAALAMGIASAVSAADQRNLTQEALDAKHEAQVSTSFIFNPHLRSSGISVEVLGDVAILSGTVQDDVYKDLAEQIAMGVDGIDDVDNKIEVDPNYSPPARVASPTGERDFGTVVEDATITASVKSKLLWNSNTSGLKVNVDTQNGKVALSGTAETAASRELAGRLASNTRGVTVVDNQLRVEPGTGTVAKATTGSKPGASESQEPVSDAWVTAKVKSTLLLSRSVDGMDISVETRNGMVSLSGTADSDAEKDLAVELAKDVRGVKQVNAAGVRIASR